MAKPCPSCGREILQDYRFCGFCGESIDVPTPEKPRGVDIVEDRGSRRLVTTLFADLTNFTRAAEGMDPETVYRAIRFVLEQLAQIIKKFGGRVDRYYGDGFLATFGIPEAIEDDQKRSLMAALEMQAFMKEHQIEALQNLSWDMQLRIGVNVGRVVSGQMYTGATFDSSVFGHAVNLASRLQASARPGTILVSEKVHRQMRLSFNFQAPVKMQLRGIDRPVVAYELIGVRADPEPMRGLAGRQTPLIGRSQEYEQLIAGLEKLTVDQQGVVALITGEAGVGKSRLADEIILPNEQVFGIVRTQSSAFEATGYALLRDILQNLAGIMLDAGLSTQQERLASFLSRTGDLGKGAEAIFEELLFSKSSAELIGEDPLGHQKWLIVAFRRLFVRLCNQKPFVVLFDDIQWADTSSLEVISHLVKLTFEIPLALIYVARSEYRDRLPDYLQVSDFPKYFSFIDIHLYALSFDECDYLVDALLGGMDLPPSLKQSIYVRTAGNPLYTEELIRMLLDHEIIHQVNGAWRLRDDWRVFIEKVPETVNGLLLSRYDHQPKHRRAILDGASVLGSSFQLNLLALILDMPENELQGEIRVLVEADFMRRSAGAGSPVYSFRHALMQEAIFETILLEDRTKLHRRVADILVEIGEQFYVDADAVIGHHLELCGSEDAIVYLIRAARQAAERYANEEAIAYFERVLSFTHLKGMRKEYIDAVIGLGEVLNRMGDSRAVLERLQGALDFSDFNLHSDYRRGDLYFQLGYANCIIGDLDESLNFFALAAAALNEDPNQNHSFQLTDIDREIGWVLFTEGKFGEALPRAMSSLSLARQAGSLAAEGSAHKLLSSVQFRTGQGQKAIAAAENSLRIREKIGDVWGAASSQTALGYFYHQVGQWSLAENMLRQAIYVQHEVGDYFNLVGSWTNLGLLLLDKSQYDEALDSLSEAIDILPYHNFPKLDISAIYQNRGLVLIRSGDVDAAIDDLEIGLETAQEQSNQDWIAQAHAYLADAYLEKGMTGEAKKLIRKSLKIVDDSTSNEFKVEVYRVKTKISCVQGEFDQAYGENLVAQDLSVKIGNRFQQASLIIDKADIYFSQPDPGITSEDILADLYSALEIFQQFDAKADMARAEERIFRIIASQTDQELEVASSEYPVIVLAMQLGLQDAEAADPEEHVAVKKLIADEIKSFVEQENVFLSPTPAGLAFVMTNVYPQAIGRMTLNAVVFTHEAIMASIRLNKRHRRKYGVDVRMKIGIAVGNTNELVRDQDGAALFASVSQLGRQANILAELAPDYQVLITGEIPSEIQKRYELNLCSNIEDRRQPQLVYLIGEMLSGSELEGLLPQSSSHLFGRETELVLLCDRIERMKSRDKGFVAYIEAEAGMGKTRLLNEVMGCTTENARFLNGKSEAFRTNISYWPLVEILEKIDLPDNPEFLRLTSMLGMRPPVDADEALLRNMPPESVRKEIFSCARDFLVSQMDQYPIILVFEDVHFIDLSSLDLLNYLLPIINEMPLALILISRSEMPGPHRAFIKKVERVCHDDYLQIQFSALSEEESLDLVRDLLKTETLPVGVDELLAPYIGHPLSIEEAIRFLVERRRLRKVNSTWQFTDSVSLAKDHMPTSYRDLLLRRLNQLDDESMHVLQAAALLGEIFDRIILNRMISGSGLAQRLTELSEKGWLKKSVGQHPSLYNFKHTLTRELIYSTLVRSKKQLLHQRAGEAIESLYPESLEENLETLAYHFENSNLLDKSLYYAIQAAEKCSRRFALEESRQYYRKAEEILNKRQQPQSRMMTRIVIGLADVYLSLGDPAKVMDYVEKLLSDSRSISKTLYAACLRRLGAALHMQGDLASALEKFDQAFEIIDSAESSELKLGGKTIVSSDEERIEILIGLSRAHFNLGNHNKAKEYAHRVVDDNVIDRYPERIARIQNLLGGISYREGDIDEARRLTERSLSIYQGNGFRDGASETYSNLGILCTAQGDHNAARDNFSLSLELHETLGDSEGIAIARNNLGQLETTQGNIVEALNHLGKAIRFSRLSELTRILTQALANLGYAYILVGDLDQALESLTEAENLCNIHQYDDLLAEVLWKKSECLIAMDDIDIAIEIAQSARDKAGELQHRDSEAQALRVYGRGLRRRGDYDEARDIAHQVWQLVENDRDLQKRAQFMLDYALALFALGQAKEANKFVNEHVRGINLVEPAHIIAEAAKAFGDLAS